MFHANFESMLKVKVRLTRALERGLRIVPSGGGAYNAPPPLISGPIRTAATNFGGIQSHFIIFSGQNFGTLGQPLQR